VWWIRRARRVGTFVAQLEGCVGGVGWLYRCAMVQLSVFGFNVQKHRRSPTPKDVIDIGIEIATAREAHVV
jgi:hypothetical protein